MSALQPAVLASRNATPPAPSRSHPECTISSRVVPSPRSTKVNSTSVRVAAIAADVPQVSEPVGRVPLGDLAPLDLGAVRCPLEDATAEARLQRDDGVGVPGRRVSLRPPARQARRPHRERVVGRAGDVEGQAEGLARHEGPGPFFVRLGVRRRGGAVFSAKSRNRPTASPHTCVRNSSTASTPSSCTR